MSLVDDLGAAIVATVNANVSDFTGALAGTGRIEYKRDKLQTIPAGNQGRAYVIANDPLIEGGGEYAESTFTNFGFDVIFDLAATNQASSAIAAAHHGMLSNFSDNGSRLFANFTDSGSNRLGGSGRVTIEGVQTEPGESPDRPRVTYTLAVRMWHTVPLS